MITVLQDQPNFPSPEQATADGIVAVGGKINAEWLSIAYPKGIFPWYDESTPPLWYSPDPRCVLLPDQVYISKSMRKVIKDQVYEVTFDHAFSQVIDRCKRTYRPGQEGTWITEELSKTLEVLHGLRLAHSIEVWHNGELAGGLYGLSMGRVFFGESMFSIKANASKAGLIQLCEWLSKWGYAIIDCQVETNHLLSMGAHNISRSDFLGVLSANVDQLPDHEAWSL